MANERLLEVASALRFAAERCAKMATDIEGDQLLENGANPLRSLTAYLAAKIERGEIESLSDWLAKLESEVAVRLMERGKDTSEALMMPLGCPSQEAVRQWLHRRGLTLIKPYRKRR